jgi:acetyltransferase-like isoleucine patch superfamily enzyme
LAGDCRIGAGAFVGAGAVVAPRVSVGEGAVVGAGAVVIRDVGPGEVVVGNPARLLRRV